MHDSILQNCISFDCKVVYLSNARITYSDLYVDNIYTISIMYIIQYMT